VRVDGGQYGIARTSRTMIEIKVMLGGYLRWIKAGWPAMRLGV